ncbi:vomeronasal type-1 receptor 3-like [Zalophus californianus]|uniref:Vomeronasal type-1 receptor n=1 Tax=Zalophus californianus TaxID=9704 RepID=A0A6J2EZG3_ZALCA|nr:vomeronasal type-1 receptor 3-like [Zalophus californianus]XP_027950992.1 vomeronasal type-1 receptor 3-like [Eumetopias jubatus]
MSFQNNARRTTGEKALKTILFFQMGIGALANVTLFFRNVSPVWHGHKQRPPHTILTHMAVANLLDFVSAGIPYMKAAFVLRKPLSSLGCKFVYYIHRVARNTTMCSTCILSTYRFLTLIPGRMVWTMLRGQAPKVIHPSCCICWMFSIFLNTYVPVNITDAQQVGNSTDTQGKWFCSSLDPSANMVILWVAVDAMFIGLMVWSSGSMVLLLHRHHQRVRYIHTPNSSHRHHLETRAAHTVLLLVATFVSFYVLNSIVTFYVAAFLDFHLWLIQTSSILALCFPAFSPFLLILHNPGPPRSCS